MPLCTPRPNIALALSAPAVTEGTPASAAEPSEKLRKFLNAAAGEGLELDGVDAADLYTAIFSGVGISASEAADPMNYKGMFEAAVSSLAEISAALGIEEEDAACANGNELILEAIARKNEAIMAAVTRPATPPPHLQLHGMAGYYVLRGAIKDLRATGRFVDEEGEATDALKDFADAAREAAHATPPPAPQPAGVVEALREAADALSAAALAHPSAADDVGHACAHAEKLCRKVLASLPEQPIPEIDLVERCREVLDWQNTGLLKGNALRDFAETLTSATGHELQSAEIATAREAMKFVISSAASTQGGGNA